MEGKIGLFCKISYSPCLVLCQRDAHLVEQQQGLRVAVGPGHVSYEVPGEPKDPGYQGGGGVGIEGQHQVHAGAQQPGAEGLRVATARGQHSQDGGCRPPDHGANLKESVT